eukprot:CAMPEP_0206049836 /NCGR_PEP_ID=MMETSP1466-20131121/27668_1 /ASSEMBLY_ACC=CAM_ASM_001126 /TAXON_ID=44452 /ORGANISM="Pavlova gyrans, Strain CCMP608" /LENGTH=39 /DNA_ID= /DNA_START= /DNA_END= /DNA_ORIENTATION=
MRVAATMPALCPSRVIAQCFRPASGGTLPGKDIIDNEIF